MIQLVEEGKAAQKLLAACEKTAFGCKIGSVARAYGIEKKFACFWLDTQSDVIYCMMDGIMVISGTILNGKEALSFLRAVGPQSIMCAVRNAEELSLKPVSTGDLLKKKIADGAERPMPQNDVQIREIHSLLEEVGMVEEFEPFYLDLSHRLRHNAAMVFTEYKGSRLLGCAVVSAISKTGAVLSALAVHREYRRMGIGTSLVRRVESQLPGKTIYVFREKDKNKEFYGELGYKRTDTWVLSTL